MLARRMLPWLLASAVVMLAAAPAAATPGDPLWTAIYDGPASLRDTPRDMVVDPVNHRVYVVGTTTVSSGIAGELTDIVTIAYDAYTGAKVWARRYDGAVHGSDLGVAIAYDGSSGGIDILGASETSLGTGMLDTVTISYAADGSRRWVRHVKNPAGDLPVNLVVDRGSTFILVNGEHGRIIAYDFAGVRLWGHTVTTDTLAEAVDLIDVGGYLIAVGTVSDGSGGSAIQTSGFSSSGAAAWTKRFAGPSAHAIAADAAVGANGTIAYVTGSYDDGSSTKITTIAYEPHDGFRFWRRSISPQAPDEIDQRPHIAVSDDGGTIAVSTGSRLGGAYTFLTRQYHGDGSIAWTARENAPGESGQTAEIAIGSGGNVLVTGLGTNSGATPGAFTLAYPSTGPPSLFEAAIANTDLQDAAFAVAPEPLGSRVFVASRVNLDIRVDAYSTF